MLAVQDGLIVEGAEARIPVVDAGLLHGDGVFEVVRLYDGRPFALAEHFDRMALSAKNLRIALDVDAVRSDVAMLLEAARPGNALLRLVATAGGRRFAFLEPLKQFPDTFALLTTEFSPTFVLDGVKSLSYGANMLASRLARERGADEALLISPDGWVLEAPTSSFFYALDAERLLTPPLSDHILDSITRRHVVAATGAEQRSLRVDELGAITEAFIASTLREVIPVGSIDGRPLQAPGPLTSAARDATQARILRLLEDGTF